MNEKIELYKHDYVILTKPKFDDFLRFSSGEIIIFNDLQEAHKNAKEIGGATANCTGIYVHMQERLLENIKTHRIRNSKK